MKVRLLIALAAAASLGGGYNSPPQPRTGPPPPPPAAGIDQRLGAKVPIELPFLDEAGRHVTLGQCTAGKPTVLVLAYYRCAMLCNEVLNALTTSLRAVPTDVGEGFNVVVVSFDPREKYPLARLKKENYLKSYGRPSAEAAWHFLTGDPLAIASLADAVGFRYQYDPDTEQYAHASGIMVLAPDGTISRYLLGVRFEPRDLRLALAEASAGKVGRPADQLLLLCFHYDPETGAYTFAILRVVKWVSGMVVLGIGGMIVGLVWWGKHRPRAPSFPIPEGNAVKDYPP